MTSEYLSAFLNDQMSSGISFLNCSGLAGIVTEPDCPPLATQFRTKSYSIYSDTAFDGIKRASYISQM